MMRCRVCSSPGCLPLWPNVEGVGGEWFICPGCGSHSHNVDADDVAADYGTKWYRDHLSTGDHDPSPDALKVNVEWFREFRGVGRDALDVGHLNGNGLAALKADGWNVHGFDVNPHGDYGPHTTIYPFFAAHLFPGLFDAVLCRDVIEHVEGWRALLMELWRATKPGGLVQIQTPRPTSGPTSIVHQRHHLQIFSVGELDRWCRWAGLEPFARKDWETGQALLCRRK